MSREDIQSGLAEILEEVAGVTPADATPEKSFTEDLDVDSLSMVEIATAVEDKFGVAIPDDELGNIKTVGDAISYIEKNQGMSPLPPPPSRRGTRPQPRPPAAVPGGTVMSTSTTDVVVTGLGATTPLGGDVATTWDALLAGRSGVSRITDDWIKEYPAQLVARLATDPAEQIDRVRARRLDRSQQVAVIAAEEAWRDSGAGDAGVDPLRIAVVFGTGIGGALTLLGQDDVLEEKGPKRVSPFTIPMLMPNGPAAAVGLAVGAKGGVHAPVSACASGAEAIRWGLDLLRFDRADIVLVGGTEACVHPLPMAGLRRDARDEHPQ